MGRDRPGSLLSGSEPFYSLRLVLVLAVCTDNTRNPLFGGASAHFGNCRPPRAPKSSRTARASMVRSSTAKVSVFSLRSRLSRSEIAHRYHVIDIRRLGCLSAPRFSQDSRASRAVQPLPSPPICPSRPSRARVRSPARIPRALRPSDGGRTARARGRARARATGTSLSPHDNSCAHDNSCPSSFSPI